MINVQMQMIKLWQMFIIPNVIIWIQRIWLCHVAVVVWCFTLPDAHRPVYRMAVLWLCIQANHVTIYSTHRQLCSGYFVYKWETRCVTIFVTHWPIWQQCSGYLYTDDKQTVYRLTGLRRPALMICIWSLWETLVMYMKTSQMWYNVQHIYRPKCHLWPRKLWLLIYSGLKSLSAYAQGMCCKSLCKITLTYILSKQSQQYIHVMCCSKITLNISTGAFFWNIFV